MVHQHFMLADNLTVLENIVLGDEPAAFPLGSDRHRRGPPRASSSSAARYGLAVDPDALVETLGVGERQRVEILKVLYRGATHPDPRRAHRRARAPGGRRAVRATSRELKREGITILFISHKLDEVLAVADAITVIRAGTTVATVEPGRRHRPRSWPS